MVNGRGVRGATDAHTGRQPRLSHWPGKPDAIFVYLTETLADSCRREFCMAADQTLLALSRAEDRIGRMIVADAWRWMPGVALRSLQARGSGNVVGDRVTLVRPARLRRRDPTTVPRSCAATAGTTPFSNAMSGAMRCTRRRWLPSIRSWRPFARCTGLRA